MQLIHLALQSANLLLCAEYDAFVVADEVNADWLLTGHGELSTVVALCVEVLAWLW